MQQKSKTSVPKTVCDWLDTMIDSVALEKICELFEPTHGAPPNLSLPNLIRLGVYHESALSGTRSAHAADLTGLKISDSAISQRVQGLDPALFQNVLDALLRPIADPRLHPQAFYKGRRLIGIDGTQFSIPNGPGVGGVLRKARTRRGRAAFAKMGMNSLCELGIHNPIAACIGRKGESEMALAHALFKRFPSNALCLGDRYYGAGRCISELLVLCQERGVEFLFRVKKCLQRRVMRTLCDGSALVEIKLADGGLLRVREIEGKIRGRSGLMIRVRLWTSLLDARAHPGNRLLKLYRDRWEQEMAIGELKQTLHGGGLLRSQKMETALYEVASMIVTQALVARMRLQVARQAGVSVLRVSFGKTLEAAQVLCVVLAEAADLLNATQLRKLGERLLDRVARQLSGRRRDRSCPRAVRQPVCSWPRKRKSCNAYGKFEYEVTKIKQ
jgi:hypothetical protein